MQSKYLLFLILGAILATSCVTERKCLQKFPPVVKTEINTIYRDTIVPVYIPKTDTVYKTATIKDTVIIHQGNTHAMSYVKYDTLKLFLWQSDTTLKVKLDSAVQVITQKDTRIIEVEKKLKDWQKGLMTIGSLVVIFFLIWLGSKFVKF